MQPSVNSLRLMNAGLHDSLRYSCAIIVVTALFERVICSRNHSGVRGVWVGMTLLAPETCKILGKLPHNVNT